MSDYIEVIAIVEGKTEQVFIEDLLCPYLACRNIFMAATQVSKPGQKGGDVRFERVWRDIENHLKQRPDIYVTTLVDYYGIKAWPGLDKIPLGARPDVIAEIINAATQKAISEVISDERDKGRFIPNMAIHEFEALLFSDSSKLARELNVPEGEVVSVLQKHGGPEAINNDRKTAPSKQLDQLSGGRFFKIKTGIAIARAIGVETIRKKCPVFNAWLKQLEQIKTGQP